MDTKKLRQKILDLAIRGKLVPQDPNDEPASVLLERIRAEKERLIKEGKIKRSKKSASDDEIEAPFEIPESWIACKLEDIAYIGTGATPDTRNNDYYYGNIPWVTSSCTKYDYIDTPTSYITQKAIDETNCRIYPKGTLIMAMYGEGKTRGQISELKIDAATNQACAAIVPYNISTAQYIKLYLKRSYLHIREQAEGGTQPNLNLSKIAQYDIYLPPLSEQKRIINEIERWFTLIDELESNEGDLLKAIDKTKSKILDLAIHGKLVPQDPNDEPASVLLDKIRAEKKQLFKEGKLKKKDLEESPISEDEIPFEIPDSLEWCKLNDLCIFLSRGKSPSYSDVPTNYPVFAQKCNLKDGGISLEQARFLKPETVSKWQEEYHLRTDDVLVNSTGTGTVCRTRLFNENCLGKYPFTVPDSHVSVVRTSDNISSAYICFLFNSKLYQDYWEDRLAGSTNQKELYIGVLQNTIIPLPPYAEQLRIVTKIEELFAVLDSIKESLEV